MYIKTLYNAHKLINWEVSPWQYRELMEENSERFKKDIK